jgi:hypothetical protein
VVRRQCGPTEHADHHGRYCDECLFHVRASYLVPWFEVCRPRSIRPGEGMFTGRHCCPGST